MLVAGKRSVSRLGVAGFVLGCLLFVGPGRAEATGGTGGESITIYTAKKILTLERSNPEAAAVAVKGKRIVAVGSLEEVRAALAGAPAELDETFEDLVILPGLIDQHLHPVLGALTLATEIIAPEDWVLPCRTAEAALTPEDYLERMETAEKSLGSEEWLFSWGYHELWHGELSRTILDRISKKRPIVVWQRSCHEFFLNTAAISALKLDEDAMKQAGEPESKMYDWDEGHWWESGTNLILESLYPKLASPERVERGLKEMVAYLHANGVTAFNEPGALVDDALWDQYQKILGAAPFYSFFLPDARTLADQGFQPEEGLRRARKEIHERGSSGKVSFFPDQIKLFADGAIISQLMQMKDGYLDGHEGVWLMEPSVLDAWSKVFWEAGFQLHIHVNGDAGLDVVLDVLEKRMREHPRADHRTVIVHFANSTEEQVGRIARLGAIVSANPYYTVGFADKYAEHGLGPKRANAMVRSASVLEHGTRLSFHSDLPMGPSAPLALASFAVNRITPSGSVACPAQRIDVEDALRAVTLEAAYSWRREHEIGSIAPGKIANFTVLTENPLTVDLEKDPRALEKISVWGTVFEGEIAEPAGCEP